MIRLISLAAVVALVVASPALASAPSVAPSQAQASAKQSEHNRQIISSAFDRWSSGGTTFFSDVLSPDVVWTIEGSGPSAGTYRGIDDFMSRAIRPFATRMRVPNRPVSKQVWADGDHVIVRWEGRGVAGDGQPYQNDYVWIFRMEDGKAVEVTAFLDLPGYDEVLRRVPAAPTGGRP